MQRPLPIFRPAPKRWLLHTRYDANGNRTGGYTTTANNQLQSDGTYTYTYDAEGNRATRLKTGTSEIEYYVYDYRNRLELVLKYDGSTALPFVHYQYDAFDRRIARWVDSTPTTPTADPWSDAVINRFVYDGDDVLFDFRVSGRIKETSAGRLKGDQLD